MRVLAAGLIGLGLSGCVSLDDRAAPVPTDVEVTMSCVVVRQGGMEDCRIIRERPSGYGMGPEALASAEEGRASVQPVGGGPARAGGRITVSMTIPIDAAAMARYRARVEVSEPRP